MNYSELLSNIRNYTEVGSDVLSDSVLGEINSCFPAKQSIEFGQTAKLDEDLLSHHQWAIEELAILERFFDDFASNTENLFELNLFDFRIDEPSITEQEAILKQEPEKLNELLHPDIRPVLAYLFLC